MKKFFTLILFSITLCFWLQKISVKPVYAWDPLFFMQPSCENINNINAGATGAVGGLTGAVDSEQCGTATPVCGHLQCRSCKQSVADPIQWLGANRSNPTVNALYLLVNTLPFGVLANAIRDNAALPARVCVNLPTVTLPSNVISTELGRVDANPMNLIQTVARILAALGGGISLATGISGAVKYLTSSGNPEAIAEAQQIITHAIGGFFIIFLSVFLLRFIGVDVLGIPGFGLTTSGPPGVTVP